MKAYYILPFLLMLYSCSPPAKEPTVQEVHTETENELVVRELEFAQRLLDSAHVTGCVLVFDETTHSYSASNLEKTDSSFLPASTFKIPHSIIQLESGNVKNLASVLKWNGEPRNFPFWEKDLSFKEAYQVSCLPCYQELAQQIGYKALAQGLGPLKYGHIVFDSSDFHRFWVRGASRISPSQQINFLKRLHHRELPIEDRTYGLMRRLMVLDSTEQYVLRGKTGWAISGGRNIGWFVGYIEHWEEVSYFATNIQATEATRMDHFGRLRIAITRAVLAKMDLMPQEDLSQ